MGILTNIVAAEEDEIEAIGESLHPVDAWSGIEMRGIDIPKIVTLHCLLTGDLFDDAVVYYEPVYISSAEGALVLRLANEAMERLTELDEDKLDDFASELAATEEFESANWELEAITAMLGALADIARLAESQGQEMFIWLHPLRT